MTSNDFFIHVVFVYEALLFLYLVQPLCSFRSKKQQWACSAAFAAGYLLLKHYFELVEWTNLASMIGLCTVFLLLFGQMPRQNMAWVGSLFAVGMALCRILVYGLAQLGGVPMMQFSVYAWPLRLTACALKFAFVWYARRPLASCARQPVGWGGCLLMTLPLGYLLFMRNGLIRRESMELDVLSVQVLLLLLGLAAFVAVLAQLFYLSAQKQSAELVLLRQAAREDYLLARQSRQQDEEVRRMYHDLKHQLTALQGVQDEQRKTEMVSSMLQHISAYEQVVESGNELVDALLARRVRAAREQGVQVELLLEACDYSFIEDADLCAIFGNAVDNAVEAVQRLPEGQPRTVTLKSAVMQGVWVLKVTNPYAQLPPRSGSGFVTSKAQKAGHGIGLRSIRYCSERYGGQVEIQTENHCFALRVMIPVGPAAQAR